MCRHERVAEFLRPRLQCPPQRSRGETKCRDTVGTHGVLPASVSEPCANDPRGSLAFANSYGARCKDRRLRLGRTVRQDTPKYQGFAPMGSSSASAQCHVAVLWPSGGEATLPHHGAPRRLMRCPRCRHENRAAAKFCEECAEPLTKRCSNCASAVSATAKFCPECAHPLVGPTGGPRFISPDAYTPKHLADKILSSRAAR